MLSEIKLDGFASIKHEVCLQTDKPVNFIYGLNGTGKSSISRYLAHFEDAKYSRCSVSPGINPVSEEVLVYNQDYINEVFYDDQLSGIFTLSKQNKKAYGAIKKATSVITNLQEDLDALIKSQEEINARFDESESFAREKVWEVKGKYSGGDRVLDYCLDGVKGSKANLLTKVKETVVAPEEPLRSIDSLRQELIQLTEMEGMTYLLISEFPAIALTEENVLLANKVIVGNQHSTISAVMEEFGNATWVRAGISYMREHKGRCPFCHQDTITDTFIKEIQEYFDASYEKDIAALTSLERAIYDHVIRLSPDPNFDVIPILAPLREKYLLAFETLKNALADDLDKVRRKLEHPNIEQDLSLCKKEIDGINAVVREANTLISNFNARVERLPDIKETIKEAFWKYQRKEYDGVISTLVAAEKNRDNDIRTIEKSKIDLEKKIEEQREIIAANQKDVVNIDEAITNINRNLQGIGITDFQIVKAEEANAYRISRSEEGEKEVFHTLSEGEKMLISFLYFIEACVGRKSADAPQKKKIIVIDDPISSLSHIHVFNVSCLIRETFIDKLQFEQVFILTHSLYFFYEIVYRKKESREQTQKLFRIGKNTEGSYIEEMKYSEIHNDYESYWSVINDPKTPPVLMANCMRNILDYFFGFVDRLEFNNIFNLKELKAVRFAAFNHFMNRESHNGPENISDFKEINYDDFHEAFRLIFEKNNFGEHYKKMKKIGAQISQ